MKKSFFLFSASLFLFLLPVVSHSSYYAVCSLRIKIDKVLSAPVYSNRHKKFRVKACFTVSNVGEGSGHNRFHCRGWEARRFVKNLYFVSKKTASKIKAGKILPVRFSTTTGENFNVKTGQYSLVTTKIWVIVE